MENQPAVSCFCLTYGRPHVLEEAIHSFLQQDYAGPKEMIVLNDYADQILTFDHPEVQVVNLPRRFRTVGEKMNAAAALASHDLLFVWDDDDVYLPHRLSFSVAHFDPEKGFFKAQHAWLWNSGQLSGPAGNIFHAGSCWSRCRFDALGGYPAEGSGYDLLFERQLESRFPGSTTAHPVAPEEIYYLYRWGGTDSFHMSGFGDLKIGQNVGQAQVEAYVRQRADRNEIPRGHVPLLPCWRADYPQLASSYIAEIAAGAAQPAP
jgi:glycosyltransferase involved in cell wall biosynthesis